MSKLHILFIASWYPTKNNPTHGIFNRLFVSAAAQHANVSVLYVSPGGRQEEKFQITSGFEEDIFAVRVIYPGSAGRRSILDKTRQYWRRIHASEQGFGVIKQKWGTPDVVQLNVILPAGPAALYLCRKYCLPLVVNEGWTGYDPEDGRYSGFITKYLTRKVISAASAILPVTSYLSLQMQQHGLKGNYVVVPNIVDTSVFVPRKSDAPHRPVQFIHVSALDDQQKNVSGILRAFARALKKIKDVSLIIAGDGGDALKLQQLAVTLKIERHVKFAGSQSPAQLTTLFQQSTALVMFSNFETFCVVVPEALACGIPVITSDAGGIMSYFNESLGIVVPKRDEEKLAQAMADMAAKKFSFETEALRNFVNTRFSKEVIARQLMDVYHSVLKG